MDEERDMKSLLSTDFLGKHTLSREAEVFDCFCLSAACSWQSRMAWLLDRSPFVCGTDAEQTLHSRCVDVEASGRRYTVIKNSVIACGLFPLLSLFLLSRFSWAQWYRSFLALFSVIYLLQSSVALLFSLLCLPVRQLSHSRTCWLYFTRAAWEQSLSSTTIHFPHCFISYTVLLSSSQPSSADWSTRHPPTLNWETSVFQRRSLGGPWRRWRQFSGFSSKLWAKKKVKWQAFVTKGFFFLYLSVCSLKWKVF